jgi:translation initiation factor IF-3
MRVSTDPRINDRIRSPQVRLVGADGQQIGVIATADALRQARELDLDLVEVAPQADPPVARIMDYGKYKYERDVKQKEARRKQSRTGLKEIKFRPKIDPHDYGTKKGHVVRFLNGGNKVKVTIMFRGREMAHTELGRKILDRLVDDLADMVTVEMMPKQEGRNMIMVIAPNKRYLEELTKERARAEAKARAGADDEGDQPEAAEPEAAEPEAAEPEAAEPEAAEPEAASDAPELTQELITADADAASDEG